MSLQTHANADRWRPSEYPIGGEPLRRAVVPPRQHDPQRRLTVIDATVAHGLSVIRFFPPWHHNQLQRDSLRLLEHGVPTDLDCRSGMDVVRVGRQGAIQEPRSRYAVRHLGRLQAGKRCSLHLGIGACIGRKAVKAVWQPRSAWGRA